MDEFPWPTQPLAVEIELKQTLRPFNKLISATIPYFHCSRPVFFFLDLPLKIRVRQIMIIHLNCKALDTTVSRGSLRNSPAF